MKTATAIIFLFLISSCNLLRKVQKSETKTDSTSVLAIDSSWLKTYLEKTQYSKQSGTERIIIPGSRGPRDDIYDSLLDVLLIRQNQNDPEGMREVLRELAKIKAATPTSFYYPQQPIIIDRTFNNETGSTDRQAFDSGAYRYSDSLVRKLEASSKSKESKIGLGLFQWIILGILAAAILYIVLLVSKKSKV